MKRFEDCKGAITDFLEVGDVVDEDFHDYFLTVLPPAFWKDGIIQIGEPYSAIGGRFTYMTIVKRDQDWVYAGLCFKGEKEPK